MPVTGGDLALDVAGETLVLLPERAAFWPAQATLLVADAHIGKAASFRAGGIPVPRGTTKDALDRLDTCLERTGASRCVFLGDLLHAREGRHADTLHLLVEWRHSHVSVDMILVRGNHDRAAGDPPSDAGIVCVDAPFIDAPFVLAHHPQPSEAGYVLAGHLHPGVRLSGPGRQRERLACFWFSARVGVLPAFGDFTGLADVDAVESDRVCVVALDRVLAK